MTPTPDPIAAFIAHYQTLPEHDRAAAGARFRAATGGTLSPYANPCPVAVAVIPVNTAQGVRVVGVRRAIEPHVGEVALPGGYINLGEEPAAAAVREAWEETGWEGEQVDFAPLGMPCAAGHHALLLFFRSTRAITAEQWAALTAKLAQQGNPETAELVLIDPSTPLAFPLHAHAVRRFFDTARPLPRRSPSGPTR